MVTPALPLICSLTTCAGIAFFPDLWIRKSCIRWTQQGKSLMFCCPWKVFGICIRVTWLVTAEAKLLFVIDYLKLPRNQCLAFSSRVLAGLGSDRGPSGLGGLTRGQKEILAPKKSGRMCLTHSRHMITYSQPFNVILTYISCKKFFGAGERSHGRLRSSSSNAKYPCALAL